MSAKLKLYTGALAEPQFEGAVVKVRGDDFVIPELNIRNRRKVEKDLAKWYGRQEGLTPLSPDYEDFRATVEGVALLALQQNYPDFTEDNLLDIFSQTQLYKIFRLALGQEEDGGGQGQPPRPTQAQTGPTSTDSLQPLRDGRMTTSPSV